MAFYAAISRQLVTGPPAAGSKWSLAVFRQGGQDGPHCAYAWVEPHALSAAVAQPVGDALTVL
jgi:hypothetical protein